jgi:hypothetical protein
MTTDPRLPMLTRAAATLLIGALVACGAPHQATLSSEPIAPRTHTPTPAPTPGRANHAKPASLQHIAFGTSPPKVNMMMTDHATGADALVGLVPTQARETVTSQLTDAHRYSFAGPLDSGNPRATYVRFVTYAFRYPTESEARDAYEAIVEALESVGQWQPSDVAGVLGDESWGGSRAADDGQDGGYVWRRSSLVLGILDIGDRDRAAVRNTAGRMDERAT